MICPSPWHLGHGRATVRKPWREAHLALAAAVVAGHRAAAGLDAEPLHRAHASSRALDLLSRPGGGLLERDLHLVGEILAARRVASARRPPLPAKPKVLEDVVEQRAEAALEPGPPPGRTVPKRS